VSARTRADGKWDHGAVNIETERVRSTDSGLAGAEMPLTLYLVKRLELVIRALMDDALRPLGVTTLQYTALTVLESRGPLSSAQLARRSFLRPQTMHEMVLSLEKRGVIAREPQQGNKRILLAQLTDTGRELLAQCNPLVLEIERELLADLAPDARAVFRDDLQHGIATLGTLSATRRATVTGTE
jgi:DNA-binding MarR family transcriptional regulator